MLSNNKISFTNNSADKGLNIPIDEGWWASVLADEAAQGSPSDSSVRPFSSGLVNVNWNYVQDLYDQDEIVNLEVSGYNRGGLLVEGAGIQGFVPVSHLVELPGIEDDQERQTKLASYLGQKLDLKVIECDSSQDRIVLSERAALAGEGKRKQLFHSLSPGETVSGTVTNITDFGVFVDLGGVEGLIHVSELSWGRVQHPGEILQIGEITDALVLQVNEDSGRVALSLKKLHSNPWLEISQKYHPGDMLQARITTIMSFGAFARLPEGIEGLIHISSMDVNMEEKKPDSFLKNGQIVRVRILHIDCERRRLGLGLVDIE